MPGSTLENPSWDVRVAALEAAVRALANEVYAAKGHRRSGQPPVREEDLPDPVLDPGADRLLVQARMYQLLGG
jgi:hypothetical protein